MAASVPTTDAARPKSTARPNNRRPVHPAIMAIETRFQALCGLRDAVVFEIECVAIEDDILAVLGEAGRTHRVGCHVFGHCCELLRRVRNATLANVEHLQRDVITPCECEIAALEAALAEQAA